MSDNPMKFSTLSVRFGFAIVLVASLSLAVPGDNNSLADDATKAIGPGEEGARRELAAFQGSWTCYSSEISGKKQPIGVEGDEFDALYSPIFMGDSWFRAQPNGKPRKLFYKVRLNSSTSPKTIDLVRDDIGESLLGIYMIDRGTLVICLNAEKKNTQRPTRFASQEGTPLTVMFFERKSTPANAVAPAP
ncbi:uncharacterized domain TIGR03067 protein [Singulisphaera sp. GP187]|uniref:TIGR03067 domain-containing protein n=1 Tax=Singulisphaera sp. GP187 TaxID=1882752 RepID=UPI00092C01DA|nr:TIGR03067 domain-containing protein [Singulisphaera sp. GP187]SIN81286.1 uncharacterized domain TIGR03067 protein [Singulisphaera sp. GP187]